jgi:hypothetical protein
VVVIIKHAYTKTSRIHTRLGSVTKPPGPVTHGILIYIPIIVKKGLIRTIIKSTRLRMK